MLPQIQLLVLDIVHNVKLVLKLLAQFNVAMEDICMLITLNPVLNVLLFLVKLPAKDALTETEKAILVNHARFVEASIIQQQPFAKNAIHVYQ